MMIINGRTPVLMPDRITLVDLRQMAESVGCMLKHDDATGMIAMVPRNECVRPAEDMEPKVINIAGVQRKEKPDSFLSRFLGMTKP